MKSKTAVIYVREENIKFYNELIKRLKEKRICMLDYIKELEKKQKK